MQLPFLFIYTGWRAAHSHRIKACSLAASCVGAAPRVAPALRRAMLHADKEALRTAYKLRLLAIREKELNYFLQNCINIATLAAMLAGFAQSGLIYTKCTPRAAAAPRFACPGVPRALCPS